LGQHTADAEWRPPTVEASSATPARPPVTVDLSGLRVIDMTTMWAGPSAGQWFAFAGAEVIHLESAQHLDGTRAFLLPSQIGSKQWWEKAAAWLSINRNKRSLALAIDTPKGRDVLRRLIAESDVVIENYAPRVMDGFGFDGPSVREINPRVIYVRMPAFGLTGPWRDRNGLAQTMEQASGMAWRTGYPDASPRIPNGPCDPLAGYHAAFAALVALHERERTGRGSLVEVAMIETAVNASAELVVEYTATGRDLSRIGNRGDRAAPQGIYRCAGTEEWLALSIATAEQWSAFKDVVGNPPWVTKKEFDTLKGRQAMHDLIDAEISQWTAEQDCDELVEAFIHRGVPAGRAIDPRFAKRHPQIEALGFYEELDHPVAGRHLMPSIPFRYRSVEQYGTKHSPLLGEANAYILSSVLGMTPAEIEDLECEQVIATRPYGT
jgi:crotonobetainyl-CoA:carnitine CoA-transferase CaiB-like acyl-CoA transferase